MKARFWLRDRVGIALLLGWAVTSATPAAGQQPGGGCSGAACPPLGIPGRAPEASPSAPSARSGGGYERAYRESYRSYYEEERSRAAKTRSSGEAERAPSKAGRCGTNMFYDKKTDTCVDARNRK